MKTVSIHAPAKGRLVDLEAVSRRMKVSIHAPAKGRLGDSPVPVDLVRFQSTPPRRGDRADRVRGARGRGFNPRPREGATRHGQGLPTVRRFQSTPPRRGDAVQLKMALADGDVSIHAPAKGRPESESVLLSVTGFNPRPREGATSPQSATAFMITVSIHAPAKGRRRQIGVKRGGAGRFQSTPPRRGDNCQRPIIMRSMEFQSTPPRRGDV